jgi:hypothetical protein
MPSDPLFVQVTLRSSALTGAHIKWDTIKLSKRRQGSGHALYFVGVQAPSGELLAE